MEYRAIALRLRDFGGSYVGVLFIEAVGHLCCAT